MSQSDAFFHAAASVLLLCLAFHHPRLAHFARRSGLVMAIGGALLPLADFGLFYLRSADRIAFLTQPHLFYGVVFGFGLIATLAGVWVFLAGAGGGGRVLLFFGAGYFVHLGLAALTPSGVPLGEPLAAGRVALPAFGAGHGLLLGVLAFALLCLELLPRRRRALYPAALVLVGAYFVVGFAQYAVISRRVADLAQNNVAGPVRVTVEATGGWPARWLVTVADGKDYSVQRHGFDLEKLGAGEEIARWNNETLLVRLLGDPIVEHFFFQVFRHPVVRTATTGEGTTLVMEELEDQASPAAGRTFFLELDQDGRNRLYRVARFD
ncbi:MAG: hypothetical protein V3S29_09120 [bacterium]